MDTKDPNRYADLQRLEHEDVCRISLHQKNHHMVILLTGEIASQAHLIKIGDDAGM